jgi:hypothetical protein
MDHWTYAVDSPFRPVAELLTMEEAGDPAQALTGGADQIQFGDAVLRAHLDRRRRSRPPQRDLRPDELAAIAGTDVPMRRDAATAAGRMLVAARTAGDQDALRTTNVGAGSGYRARADQERLWCGYFERYYRETAAARAGLPGGAHGPAAVRYMIEDFRIPARIAAPGYSNHQAGIAIDLQQRRTPGHAVANSTSRRAVQAWRATWLDKWLSTNAASFDFQPYRKEPWHLDLQARVNRQRLWLRLCLARAMAGGRGRRRGRGIRGGGRRVRGVPGSRRVRGGPGSRRVRGPPGRGRRVRGRRVRGAFGIRRGRRRRVRSLHRGSAGRPRRNHPAHVHRSGAAWPAAARNLTGALPAEFRADGEPGHRRRLPR